MRILQEPVLRNKLILKSYVKVFAFGSLKAMYSMTGFAKQSLADGSGLVWEIRGVNHRYADIQFRLPDMFKSAEHVFRQIIQGYIKRGRVEATLRWEQNSRKNDTLMLNHERIAEIAECVNQLGKKVSISSVDPLALLNWPGVLMDTKAETEDVTQEAKKQLEQALILFNDVRHAEGKKIHEVILGRLTKMSDVLEGYQESLSEIAQSVQDKLLQRLAQFELKDLDPQRIHQEVAFLLQKNDVHEELDRLRMHIQAFKKCMASDEPQGKRMDFLAQEMHREANTLGSKSDHHVTSQASVSLKVLIEQIREQVQNIE